MSVAERLQRSWYQGIRLCVCWRPWSCCTGSGRSQAPAFPRRSEYLYRAPVPVVVVGNITVGGTGKTPLILWLIEHCQRRGLRVGVVSRGYAAEPPTLPWRVRAEHPAQHCGDEPLLIVQRTGVPLMIDPDRARAVRALLEQEPLDLILSDDGLQHYRLARDLELVLIDAARGLATAAACRLAPA